MISLDPSQLCVQVKSEVLRLASKMDRSEVEEREETCPVCFSVPEGEEERVRLQLCGHLYCRDCLHLAIASAAWPLTCSRQDCDQLLVVEDFKTLGPEERQKLQKNALDHKLSDVNSELRACPSPNCNGVYRAMREGETENFFCMFCGVHICRRYINISSLSVASEQTFIITCLDVTVSSTLA